MTTSPLYAVIDLGSNSFHMLITRLVEDSVQVVDKVKRKVRLASGLNENNKLDDAAFARGLECLSFFAERLQDIPAENIRIVATATLRIATNADEFIVQANRVLGQEIKLLSGEQEAKQIYLGVAHTCCSADHRLVIDIGGASTEIIVGNGFEAQKVTSLNMGCVTFNNNFFNNDQLSLDNFNDAITTAKKLLHPIVCDYQTIGWQSVLGGSGTMQALAEILAAQHLPAIISASFLQDIKIRLLSYHEFSAVEINGLSNERIPVFASGLAILIAIFDSFDIKSLNLSSGALREGLLYEMLPNMRLVNIRQRTISSLIHRFHIDEQQSARVKNQIRNLFDQITPSTTIAKNSSFYLLLNACDLIEVGLLLEYKHHQKHGAYIIKHADLPGFTHAERTFLVAIIELYKGKVDLDLLVNQTAVAFTAAKILLLILRIAVILCHRRADDVLPKYQVRFEKKNMTLFLPEQWLLNHPLILDELLQENINLEALGLTITIEGTS